MDLKYCPVCGTRLHPKPNPPAEPTLYCGHCGEYRFPIYSTAVSVIVLDEARENMLLIRQYGKPDLILVAGYVDKGETAEAAVIREVGEELGLRVERPQFLCSHYYTPSETLMLNYLVTTDAFEPHPNWEVDSWEWVPVRQALGRVRHDGLAEKLLRDYADCIRGADVRD